MNINNYKYGIFIDDNGITGIHNYYERLEDAKYFTGKTSWLPESLGEDSK